MVSNNLIMALQILNFYDALALPVFHVNHLSKRMGVKQFTDARPSTEVLVKTEKILGDNMELHEEAMLERNTYKLDPTEIQNMEAQRKSKLEENKKLRNERSLLYKKIEEDLESNLVDNLQISFEGVMKASSQIEKNSEDMRLPGIQKSHERK